MERISTRANSSSTVKVAILGAFGLLAFSYASEATPSVSSDGQDKQKALCRPNEAVLASCSIGHKSVSVCGAKNGPPSYRFGTPQKIEIEAHDIRMARRAYSGGGETQILVRNNTYRYILYDRMVRSNLSSSGENDPEFVSGILVMKSGKLVESRLCPSDGQVLILSGNLEEYLKDGDFVEH